MQIATHACIVDIQVHCTCKLILCVVCMCEALYPLHAASDIDSCMTNRAWMLQDDEPHVRGHHVDFGSESEVNSDEDDSEDHNDSYAEDDDDSDQES